MSFANLIGLLGLLGVGGLIIIYLLRPHYQQKFISSTYVWKLSLRYRKREIPISKIRDILLLICQILILTSCALMLARPILSAKEESERAGKIVIIDASGNMMASVGDAANTRFDRAVREVGFLAEDTLAAGGGITVILADSSPEIFVQGVGEEDTERVLQALESLVSERDFFGLPAGCSYGEPDYDAAIDVAQSVLDESPKSEVLFYAATTFIDRGNVTVVDVSEEYREDEWNAAILNVTEIYEENYYSFAADVVSYCKDAEFTLKCTVYDVNETTGFLEYTARIRCMDDSVMRFTFPVADRDDYVVLESGSDVSGETSRIYSYGSAVFELLSADGSPVGDCLSRDDAYFVYGGQKPLLNAQYCSANFNSMTSAVLYALQASVRGRWDLDIREETSGIPVTEGYDLYVYENLIPAQLPQDGVIFLFNPGNAGDLGITVGEEREGDFFLSASEESPLLEYVHPEDIYVSKYRRMSIQDGDFTPVLYCAGEPALIVKNAGNVKIAVFAFNVNFSLVSMEFYAFAPLIYNLFNFFLPSAFDEYVYQVEETVELNSRTDELLLKTPDNRELDLTELPQAFLLDVPGSYQVTMNVPTSETPVTLNFFVKLAQSQSDIFREVDELKRLQTAPVMENADSSLILFFAIALTVLLFAEWGLHARERI